MNNNDFTKRVSNLDYLQALANGNEQFIKEMISIFLVEMPQEIKSLEESIRKKSFEKIKLAAHKLRSTLPFVGLDKVIEKEVIEIEKMAAEKTDVKEIEPLFDTVKKACEKAAEELKE